MEPAPRNATVTERNDLIVAVSPGYLDLLGYRSSNQLLGEPIQKVIGARDRERITQYGRDRTMKLPAPIFYEFRAERSDGSELPLLARIATHSDRSGLLITTSVEPSTKAALTPETFAALYDEHAGRVFALLLSMTANRAEAEDLLHDAFLQAWQQRERYDPARASLVAWLIMIARSRALDRQRKSGRQVPLSQAKLDVLPDTDIDQVARVDGRLAAAALNRLAASERSVMQLTFFGGLSHSEIAAKLSTPLGTVKSRSLSAMKKLRKSFC